jgi:hypothetical protein
MPPILTGVVKILCAYTGFLTTTFDDEDEVDDREGNGLAADADENDEVDEVVVMMLDAKVEGLAMVGVVEEDSLDHVESVKEHDRVRKTATRLKADIFTFGDLTM